jgi:hypothetical protein
MFFLLSFPSTIEREGAGLQGLTAPISVGADIVIEDFTHR